MKLPSVLCLAKPYQKNDIDPRAQEIAKKFKEDGVVVLPDKYTQFADYLIKEYLLKNKGTKWEEITK